ncbi:TPA: 50S ribosomal protein L30 [Candidatus Geothermarchaeota archaeon]|nr:50S ribosomal protein L30 [Candidatus Geothermarchaeota archaeon]HIQ12823.1 50S ribosomal protein L30 [Thermoprotei archaeon]
MGCYLVVRIRGVPDVRYDIRETLKRLHLVRKFHATIVPDTPEYIGMLKKVENYVFYGPIEKELLRNLILSRGRITGNKSVTIEYLEAVMGIKFDELLEKLLSGEIKLKDIKGLKPVFRLHPPRGGFKKSIKKHVKDGGELGYREDIQSVVTRML